MSFFSDLDENQADKAPKWKMRFWPPGGSTSLPMKIKSLHFKGCRQADLLLSFDKREAEFRFIESDSRISGIALDVDDLDLETMALDIRRNLHDLGCPSYSVQIVDVPLYESRKGVFFGGVRYVQIGTERTIRITMNW